MQVDTWRLYPVFALAVLAGGSVWNERITRIDDPAASIEQTGPGLHRPRHPRGRLRRRRAQALAGRRTPGTLPRRRHHGAARPAAAAARQEGATTITARARRRTRPAASRSTLAGEVRVRRPGQAGAPAARARLRTLAVFPDAQRARRLAGPDDQRRRASAQRACARTTCSARSNSSARSATMPPRRQIPSCLLSNTSSPPPALLVAASPSSPEGRSRPAGQLSRPTASRWTNQQGAHFEAT